MVRSLRQVSLENTVSVPAVFISTDTSLDRLGSEFFVLCLYGLRSSSTIFAKIVREKIHTYHACLRVLHSEYSDIVVA